MTSPAPGVFTLRDYALVADGERGALIDPYGNVAWLCAPCWHDPPVLSSLIGGRSVYAITPAGRFTWGGFYERGSLIWRSRWVTETGVIECREALALPAEPGRLVLLRRVCAVQGSGRLTVTLAPRADFDARPLARPRTDEAGVWHGRCGELRMRWQGAAEARVADHELRAELALEPGEERELVLEIGASLPPDAPDPQRTWEETEASWSRRAVALPDSLAPREVAHAAAVLHGLTSPGGGMVAAATMSLPERAGEGRNYDYRYVWIRDQCYAGRAAALAGIDELLDAAVRFVGERLLGDGDRLMPAYTTGGAPVPGESRIDLPGYPGGSDVLGNHVRDQFQLDALGEALLLLAVAQAAGRLDGDGWRAAEVAAAAIGRRWTEPDAGVWELAPAAWTHSRLICVAGLRAIAARAPRGPAIAEWTALAETILAETARTSLARDGHWQRAPGDARLDVALLLPALRGAIPADDPRSRATLDAVLEQLTTEQHAYRFRQDERPLAVAEGAFLLCGLWVALACQQAGRPGLALRFFERVRGACGPPGLYAEEWDVQQRQLRGNLPQAFVHATLIEAAVGVTAG